MLKQSQSLVKFYKKEVYMYDKTKMKWRQFIRSKKQHKLPFKTRVKNLINKNNKTLKEISIPVNYKSVLKLEIWNVIFDKKKSTIYI